MRLADHVTAAFDDRLSGKFEPALLHACIAVDATARRLFPTEKSVRRRYVACLRSYYWLIEPMIGSGINLEDMRFENVPLRDNPSPDLAEIIYHMFRNNHAHGEEVPRAFWVVWTEEGVAPSWILSRGELHMPETVLWALLSVAVFSRANSGEHSVGNYYLSLGDQQFPISDWWGREDEFRPLADGRNTTRVKLESLGSFVPMAAAEPIQSAPLDVEN